jgi:hypothetical protein
VSWSLEQVDDKIVSKHEAPPDWLVGPLSGDMDGTITPENNCPPRIVHRSLTTPWGLPLARHPRQAFADQST